MAHTNVAARLLCYVAHPLGAGQDREHNRRAAAQILCALQESHPEKVFVASWITLASVWPESTHYRDIGIAADLALIDHCQELWLTGPRISPGMRAELEHAEKLGLVIVDRLAPLQLTDLTPGHDRTGAGPPPDSGKIGPECFGGSDYPSEDPK